MSNLDDVEDLAINGDFDVFISHRGDIATVSQRDAFEQEAALRLQAKYNDNISSIEFETVVQMLLSEAQRVAQDMDMLDSVSAFQAQKSPDDPNTAQVTIIYDTGEPLTFEVN
jgi:hypothetical protein